MRSPNILLMPETSDSRTIKSGLGRAIPQEFADGVRRGLFLSLSLKMRDADSEAGIL